jgi:hypothetical protein
VRNCQEFLCGVGTQELTVVGFLLGLRVGEVEGFFVGFYQTDVYKAGRT